MCLCILCILLYIYILLCILYIDIMYIMYIMYTYENSTQTRPHGLTLAPWRAGKCLVWDATVVENSHVARTCSTAADAEELKQLKSTSDTYESPLDFETLGSIRVVDSMGALVHNWVRSNISRISQRLSLEILRGNVGSILGSYN